MAQLEEASRCKAVNHDVLEVSIIPPDCDEDKVSLAKPTARFVDLRRDVRSNVSMTSKVVRLDASPPCNLFCILIHVRVTGAIALLVEVVESSIS